MTDTSNPTAVRVPGATLQYELTGSGPLLLLVHGGIADSAMFTNFVSVLGETRTVVSYDRRGYGDSPLDDPEQEQTVELHADDAHRLLATITDEPADVLGLSSGAFMGLELAVSHPEQIGTVVAFEPPLVELLDDREWFRADGEETYETYRREGAAAALARFTRLVQNDSGSEQVGPPVDPAPEMLEFMARMARNMEFFFAHEFRQFGAWLPDFDALANGPARVVVGGGAESGSQPARRAADALAERLGTRVVQFPGDHGSGISNNPDQFAAALDVALSPRR